VGAQIDPVVKAFNAKYPFLSIKVLKKDPPELVKQVGEEYKAGIFTVDAYELDDFGLRPLLEMGVLAPSPRRKPRITRRRRASRASVG